MAAKLLCDMSNLPFGVIEIYMSGK